MSERNNNNGTISQKKWPTWEEKLNSADPNIKELALKLIAEVRKQFDNVLDGPTGDSYRLDNGKKGSNYRFAVLFVTRKEVGARIRVDSGGVSDPSKLLGPKVYNWYFSGDGQEREIRINNESQIPQAVELIKHSYRLSSSPSK